jgi:hypothetical protein
MRQPIWLAEAAISSAPGKFKCRRPSLIGREEIARQPYRKDALQCKRKKSAQSVRRCLTLWLPKRERNGWQSKPKHGLRTINNFIRLLSDKPGCVMLTLESNTDARVKKTGNPHPLVRKIAVTNGVAGINWGAAMGRLLDALRKDGHEVADDYEVGERKNGTENVNLKVAEKDGRYYVNFVPKSVQSVFYVDADSGKMLDYDADVKPFLAERTQSKMDAAGITENKVISIGKLRPKYLTYRMDNITRVKMGGFYSVVTT